MKYCIALYDEFDIEVVSVEGDMPLEEIDFMLNNLRVKGLNYEGFNYEIDENSLNFYIFPEKEPNEEEDGIYFCIDFYRVIDASTSGSTS